MQETSWAKKNRKTGEAVESRCLMCYSTCARAFPHLSWETLIARVKTSATFGREVSQALRSASSGSKATGTYTPEEVKMQATVGYMVEQEYVLYSTQEFEDLFEVKPTEAGVAVEKFFDQFGQEFDAVAVSDSSCKRKLRVFSLHGLDMQRSSTQETSS